ncbi:MAG: glycosyltransferase family 2 protein [Cetobacterium sp.]|nr:glycosyltransferase family 2 protein [Cetobacterium sp.]
MISVIIPIYNASDNLESCLRSVLEQTYLDIEIICIDDGSTDTSLKILKKYKEIDNRIIIITQENKGVSSARNEGIKKAIGTHVIFLDSDDKLPKTAIYELNNFKNYDLVCGSFRVEKKIYELEENEYKDIKQFIINKKNTLYYSTVCFKLLNLSIIKQEKILFPKIEYGEDTSFMYDYLKYIKTIKTIKTIVYWCREREGSLSRKKIKNSWEIFEMLYHKGKNLVDDKNKIIFFNRGMKATLILEMKNKKNKEDIKKILKKIRNLLIKEKLQIKNVSLYEKILCYLINKEKYIFLYLLLQIRLFFIPK